MSDWRENWKQAMGVLEANTSEGSGGIWINIPDGGSASMVFLDDKPFGYTKQWDNLEGHGTPSDSIADPSAMMPNGQPRYESKRSRVAFNVYCTESKEVKIFDANQTTAKDLFQAFNMMDGMLTAVLDISRKGSKKDTVFTITKGKKLSDKQVEKMRKVLLSDGHDLRECILGPDAALRSAAPVAAPAAAPAAAPVADNPFDDDDIGF